MKTVKGTRAWLVLASAVVLAVACSLAQNTGAGLWGRALSDAESKVPTEGALPGGGDDGQGTGAEPRQPELDAQLQIALAYPALGPRSLMESRAFWGSDSEWPEMLFLGESGTLQDEGRRSLGQTWELSITPTEIRIVPVGDVVMMYWVERDELRRVPDGEPLELRSLPDQPVVFIPPNSSLVMVRVTTDPSGGRWVAPNSYECAEEETDWDYSPDLFLMGYPELGEAPVHIGGDAVRGNFGYWFGEYQGAGEGCPGDGWLYFFVPAQGLDPSLLWLEYVSSDEVLFWTMAQRP
jgi:hypothetical protein